VSGVVPPGYKQTEVGVIPEDWDVVKLGDLSETSSGTTPSRSQQERYFDNGSTAWVKTLDLNNSYIFSTDETITELALKETSLRCFPVDTVLVAMYGGFNQIGRTGLLKTSATVNQAITAIKPDKRKLVSDYLLRNLNYRIDYWKSVASSSRKDPNITGKDVRDYLIAVPSVTEQQRIAEALSDADALIEGLGQLVSKKLEVKQGAMQELLSGNARLYGFSKSWEEKTFGTVFDFYPTATNARSDLSSEGTASYVHYGDIHTKFHSHLDFSRSKLPQIDRRLCKNAALLQNGDWIMADASEDFDGVGKSVEVAGLGRDEAAVSGLHTFLLREKRPTFAPVFKGHLGNLKSLHNQFLKVTTGMKVFGVSKTALKDLTLSIPDWEEQTAIASILSDMDAEIAGLEVKLGKARRVKEGMMQDLLTGKVRLV